MSVSSPAVPAAGALVDDLQMRRIAVVALQKPHVVGAGTDDGDARQRRIERQQVAGVLEQDDGLLRDAARQGA